VTDLDVGPVDFDGEVYQLDVPVVLIVYKRPHETSLVIEAIRKVQPPRLYVIGEGVDDANCHEGHLVEQVRSLIEETEWGCKVFTNYADRKMGLRKRITTGLDWVFSQEERAIILEDDCVPSERFFRFAAELLEFHSDDLSVAGICGTKLGGPEIGEGFGYFFSRYPSVWGWATWKRTWDNYKAEIPATTARKIYQFKAFSPTKNSSSYWASRFNSVARKRLDTWDYQLAHLSMLEDCLWVVPSKNLVSNVGFGLSATHTLDRGSQFAELARVNPQDRLKFETILEANAKYDLWLQENVHRWRPISGMVSKLFDILPRKLGLLVRFWFVSLREWQLRK
jgi:hypothetical protein